MNPQPFTTADLLLIALGLYVFVFAFVIRTRAARANTPGTANGKLARRGTNIIILYALWITGLGLLAERGFFEVNTFPPRFALFFIVLITLTILLIASSTKRSLAFLHKIPVHWLIYFQAYRLIVEFVLWMLFQEQLVPREMTFEGRNIDILIGVLAPFAGFVVQKKRHYVSGIVFNIVGLLALINIVTIVVRAVPSPFQQFDALLIASYFPGVLIPSLLAPAAVFAHILSLKQLLAVRKNDH